MALSAYQFNYFYSKDGNSGSLLFGAGTPYAVMDIDGLAGLPDLRVQDAPRGYSDGYFTGRDFFDGRHLTFTLNIFAGNGNSAQQNWALLQAALNPISQFTTETFGVTAGNSYIQFKLSATDGERVINARVRTRKALVDPEYTYGMIRAQIEFFAPDYRYYSNTITYGGTLTPALANGRIYNRTYNLVYSQALRTPPYSPALGSVDNSTGTAPAAPLFLIQGPVVNPQISNYNTGEYIQLVGSFASTDQIRIDFGKNTVTLNGSNARNLMTGGSSFFAFGSAAVTPVYFSAASSSGTADYTYRVAYV
jgi:hypothetical protein